MSRKLIDDLVLHNPMLIEVQRFQRKYLTFSGNNTLGSAMLAVTLVSYCGLVLVVMSGRGEIPPLIVTFVQLFGFCLLAPAMMHGAIAGERERRSWDLLLVAPITKAQIVVGKTLGALAALGSGFLLMLFPTLLAAITYDKTNWLDLGLGLLVSFTFALLACSLTLFLSARVRRPFMALGASLATMIVLLVVFPIIAGFLTQGVGNDTFGFEFLMLFHPFVVLYKLLEAGEANIYSERSFMPDWLWGWPQVFVYVTLSIVFIVWAERTLHFAENDVRFLPQTKKDA